MQIQRLCVGFIGLAALLVAGCSEDPGPSPQDVAILTDGFAVTDTVTLDSAAKDTALGDSASSVDTGPPNTGDTTAANDTQPTDTGGTCPGGFGCPCASHDDCLNEFCIEGPDGNLCTKPCVTECPNGFDCVSTTAFSSDPISICVPRHIRLCRPCDKDDECKDPFAVEPGRCLPSSDPALGSFCGSSCDFGVSCPDGYTCKDVTLENGSTIKQCQKTEGECECRTHWEDLGLSTSCKVSNDFGTCDGYRICAEGALTNCDATPAQAETCNGEDDNCNGIVDDLEPEACENTNEFGTCKGTTICTDDKASACDAKTPAAEVCNGLDDDCDGVADEGTCSDGLACTLDSCTADGICQNTLIDGNCLIEGVCYQEGASNPNSLCEQCVTALATTSWAYGDGTACNDGNPCSHTDVCNGGVCAGTSYVCNDGLNCTGDLCDGDGGCQHDIANGFCAISGMCYADGQASPSNACNVCKTGSNTQGWSNAISGTTCDDGELCTYDDKCQAGGQCVGVSQSCNDGKSCTVDSCDGNGGCINTPTDACLIGNKCYTPGQANPSNPCEECNPNLSTTGWSPGSGNACNDGLACTQNDTCQAGVCLGAAYSCDDSLSCTTDVCDGNGGCSNTLKGSKCLISGTCYSAGTTQPGNICKVCKSNSPKGWSNNDGQSCNDGNSCTKSDTCGGGSCSGTAIVDGYEGNNSKTAAHDLGSVEDNDSYPKGTFTATLYGNGDTDWYKYYDEDKWNGVIKPRVDLKNIPAGSNYRLCAYYDCSGLSLSCEKGTSSTYAGLKGCCSNNGGSSNETVKLNPDCSGWSDDGTVYVRVDRISGSWTCDSYTLEWGDD